MTDRAITITHEGKTYTGEVAVIKRTSLGWEDHGILTAFLHCEWPGAGIGVGGFCLDRSSGTIGQPRIGTAYGLDHIMRLMETVGVRNWEDLEGKSVVVLFDEGQRYGGGAKGIAHILNNKVFILKDHAELWIDKGPTF